MARNFRELEAKMSPESQARARAIADKHLASAELPPQVSEILEKALALSSDELGLMIDFLIYSLDHEPNAPAEEAVEAAWKEEIERRLADIRTGRAKTVPLEEVLARARARQQAATAADTAGWFKKLDEFGPEPFGDENGTKPPKK